MQFCKTSFKKWTVKSRADGLVPMCFAIFPRHVSKVPRLQKSDVRSLRSAAPFTQNNFSKPADLMLTLQKNATPPRRSAPYLPNISDADLSRAAPADHVLLTLGKVQNPLRLPEDMPVQHPKVVRTSGVFGMFTSTCASRHSRMQLLTSHATRWLRTRHFSEPTFRPSRATKHWKKNSVSQRFYLFAHFDLLSFLSTDSLFTDSFSSDSFSSLTAASAQKSKAWLLNFLGSNVVILSILQR